LISLRRPSGKSLISSISSWPPMAAHLWRSKWRTLRFKWDGSCLCFIHHSMSRYLNCIVLFVLRTVCKNIFIVISTSENSLIVSLAIYPQIIKLIWLFNLYIFFFLKKKKTITYTSYEKYLDIANQSNEECQAPQRDAYTKCQLQRVTCRLKYVPQSTVNMIIN
jgi:hypothetical protein